MYNGAMLILKMNFSRRNFTYKKKVIPKKEFNKKIFTRTVLYWYSKKKYVHNFSNEKKRYKDIKIIILAIKKRNSQDTKKKTNYIT